ncbi:MAG: CsgG/HfaB family protein [Candidatus Marinimicrobia bacterium]|nr:CsgG/HfaB family protein [Candidatus Neomarinimicrobiota bacterium]
MRHLKIKNLIYILSVFSILLLLTNCATFTEYGKLEAKAREYYTNGSYDLAVNKCVKALKTNPKYKKARELIQNSFRAATKHHNREIKQLKASNNKYKWDDIVDHYKSLNKINNYIATLPPIKDIDSDKTIVFDTKDYTSELANARNKAAEVHYVEGTRLKNSKDYVQAAREFMLAEEICTGYKDAKKQQAGAHYLEAKRIAKSDKREMQKEAAKEFKEADRIYSGYKDARDCYEKCRKAGILRIAIIPFKNKISQQNKYGAISETITDKITSNIMNDPSATEFLEIISRTELYRIMQEHELEKAGFLNKESAVEAGKVLGVHEIIVGKITQIIYAKPRIKKRKEKQKDRAVVDEKVYYDDDGDKHTKDVYGDVYAKVTFYTKLSEASIVGSYQIINVKTAKVKQSKSFSGKSNFKCKWATFSGDERALSREAIKLCKKGEDIAPVEAQLVQEAANNLSESLTSTIKAYAR